MAECISNDIPVRLGGWLHITLRAIVGDEGSGLWRSVSIEGWGRMGRRRGCLLCRSQAERYMCR